jgi:hypothetical protein
MGVVMDRWRPAQQMLDVLMMRNGIFISKFAGGRRFVASRSRKGLRTFLWMAVSPDLISEIIKPNAVPLAIRRQAYRHLGKLEQ